MTINATTKDNKSKKIVIATESMFRVENGIMKEKTVEIKNYQAFLPNREYVRKYIMTNITSNHEDLNLKKEKHKKLYNYLFDKMLNNCVILRINYRDYNNASRYLEQVVYISSRYTDLDIVKKFLKDIAKNPNELASMMGYDKVGNSECFLMSLINTNTANIFDKIFNDIQSEINERNAA